MFGQVTVVSIDSANNRKKPMSKLAKVLTNLRGYFNSLMARRKRRKKNKKDDPFIYPHF